MNGRPSRGAGLGGASRSPGAGLSSGRLTASHDEQRITALTRVLLAATALSITRIDPAEPSRFVGATYVLLAAYLAFATVVWALERHEVRGVASARLWLLWVDVAVYASLIAMSGGSNSIYFALFFFGILTGSLDGGFAYGILVTLVSVGLFAVIGYLTRPPEQAFELDRFLLRTATLSVLGYLLAYRGGYEVRLRRRLALLRELSTDYNPRFGADHMLARSLELLRAFFDADLAMAVVPSATGTGYELRSAGAGMRNRSDGTALPAAIADLLLDFGDGEPVYVNPRRPSWLSAASLGTRNGQDNRAAGEQVTEMLGGRAFMSVPLQTRGGVRGRLYVAATQPRFDRHDCEFLLQAASQIVPALAHLELVERMATRAAEDERERIALDIHDRLIQPYIGLQIGIAAVRGSVASLEAHAAIAPVVERIEGLETLAQLGINDLRGYVQGLRHGSAAGTDTRVVESLRRFAQRFQEATGIVVTVEIEGQPILNARLAAEVLSMVSEAISNVRRHTRAPHARVLLTTTDTELILRVENGSTPGAPPQTFVPRSIAQRAAAADGSVTVESGANGTTAVVVTIPL